MYPFRERLTHIVINPLRFDWVSFKLGYLNYIQTFLSKQLISCKHMLTSQLPKHIYHIVDHNNKLRENSLFPLCFNKKVGLGHVSTLSRIRKCKTYLFIIDRSRECNKVTHIQFNLLCFICCLFIWIDRVGTTS